MTATSNFVLAILAAAILGGALATSAGATDGTGDENQKAIEACHQEVEAANQSLEPVDREDLAHLLSDASDACRMGDRDAAERLVKQAHALDDAKKNAEDAKKKVKTE